MASSRRAATAKVAHRGAPALAVRAEPHDESLLHRLLFFSDAVFAIVLTLLVLELRPPEAHGPEALRAALAGMGGHFVAFAMTFTVIGIFWAAHMNTLRALRRFDWPTALVNLVFLFPICLLPFVTGLMAEARFEALAWTIYSWVLIAASAANVALVLTLWRGKGRLTGGASPGLALYRVSRAAAPGLAFGAGLGALALGRLDLARFCWLLIPALFLASRLLLAPKRPA
ncbi:TMEM175 family protein [Phenylobacterium sp.]|uniref:TMEM175 family protein n=1 Tax=Phenylobacterium sp. TaxID=1871053 RepID=UPI003BAC9813